MKSRTATARRLRREPTWAEKRLWDLLRNRRFAADKFRRQYPVGRYFADFYCASARLAVELDGDPHGTPSSQKHDAEKDQFLRRQRIEVLRFWNIELKENEEGVLTAIWLALEKRTAKHGKPSPQPSPLNSKGEGAERQQIRK
jgi:very-short-patch-repair endonuclease